MRRKVFLSLMALVLVLSFALSNVCVANNVGSLNNKKSSIEKDIENKKNQINKMKKESSSLEEEIKKLDEEATKASEELEKIEKQLEELSEEIEKTEEELKAAEKRLEESKDKFNARLRVMYKKGNVGYLEVLLSSANIRDFLTRKDMVQAVVNHDVELMEYIKEQKDIIDKKETELKSQKSTVEVSKKEAKEKEKELIAATKTKETAMNELKKDMEKVEAEYAELEKESKQIADEIKRREVASTIPAPSRGGGGKSGNSENNSGGEGVNTPAPAPAPSGGAMAWPAPGPVTSPFGQRWGRLHSGIDIGVPVGSPVVAADNGVVILAKTGYNGGYGNYIVVSHGGGISTLYAHNSSLTVGVGARVSRGQVIARSGNTGRSTGPHLHFEVRVNGRPVDPMPYLR